MLPSMLVNRGRGTSSSIDEIDVVLLSGRWVGGEYCTGEKAIGFAGLPDEGMSRGGEVATGASVRGEVDKSTTLDAEGAGSAAAESVDVPPAAGCAVEELSLLVRRDREKPNQDDRAGVDLDARTVFCGSTVGNGTSAVSCGGVGVATVSGLASCVGAGSSTTPSMAFGDSVRSTGFDADPGVDLVNTALRDDKCVQEWSCHAQRSANDCIYVLGAAKTSVSRSQTDHRGAGVSPWTPLREVK